MYKGSRWARDIIDLQHDDGSWGYFHTLSEPKKHPVTTEQALRRLRVLGFSMCDEPIQKAVSYLCDCLSGAKQIPDRREKLHNWDIFTDIMFSTWIRIFTGDENKKASQIAKTWAGIITSAFSEGVYSYDGYAAAYESAFGMKPKGGRLTDFVSFYLVSLLADQYDEATESRVFDYILNKSDGIYYIYGQQLSALPGCFASIQASRYLGAVELLSSYRRNIHKLGFVADWLEGNRNELSRWDMGGSVKDNIYFPLSDTWRQKSSRELDCTFRIQNILSSLG